MWECFNISPVAQTAVHCQMLISFPMKPGGQEELREKGTFVFFPNENMDSIQSNSMSKYLIYFVSLSKENTSYYSLYIPGYVTDGRRSEEVAYEKNKQLE